MDSVGEEDNRPEENSSYPLLHAKIDTRPRGFDHGVFVPMLALNAPSHIPVVTVSLANDYDTRAHIALGEALAPLREEGILLVGSGLGFHNLRAFFGQESDRQVQRRAKLFDDGLEKLILGEFSSNSQGKSSLEEWKALLPWSEFCHPTAEHLMPLFVVVGSVHARTKSNFSTTSPTLSSEYDLQPKKPFTKIPFDLMGIPTCHYIFD